MSLICDVKIKELQTFTDERGFFREIIRNTDDFFKEGFGQFSVSKMHTGVVKAWHIHKTQVDWWYADCGVIKVALHDLRKNSPTFGTTMELLMGDDQKSIVLKVPPGVAHGCKCLSGPAYLFYVTSLTYDANEEGRIQHNDPQIGYDWLKEPVIK